MPRVKGVKYGGNELIKVDIFKKAGLEAGMHVADLGCGNLGYFAIPSAKIVGKNGMVYAVDILKSVLESVTNLAKHEGLENLKTIWSNLEIVGATKIAAESLDAAYLINILFQSHKDDLVIKEAYRLLKSGGKLIIIDWKRVSTPFGPPMADRTKPEEVKGFARMAGFKLVDEFEAGRYHYGIMFVK